MERPHRKRLKRYDHPGHPRELTFSTYRRLPLLEDATRVRTVFAAIRNACERNSCPAIAFVVMPEHVHLLVMPHSDPVSIGSPISSLLSAIKRPSSFRIKRYLAENEPSLLETLTIRERPGKSTFRFWQEGGGYDRKITNLDTLRHSIEYIHANPVRRGLCGRPEDYPWSSARQWLFPDEQLDEWMPEVSRTAAR